MLGVWSWNSRCLPKALAVLLSKCNASKLFTGKLVGKTSLEAEIGTRPRGRVLQSCRTRESYDRCRWAGSVQCAESYSASSPMSKHCATIHLGRDAFLTYCSSKTSVSGSVHQTSFVILYGRQPMDLCHRLPRCSTAEKFNSRPLDMPRLLFLHKGILLCPFQEASRLGNR